MRPCVVISSYVSVYTYLNTVENVSFMIVLSKNLSRDTKFFPVLTIKTEEKKWKLLLRKVREVVLEIMKKREYKVASLCEINPEILQTVQSIPILYLLYHFILLFDIFQHVCYRSITLGVIQRLYVA